MLDVAVNLCKNIIDFITLEKKIESENKKRVSDILNEISDILDKTAMSLKNDEYPHKNCEVMRNLSVNLCKQLSMYIPEYDLNVLQNCLMDASRIESEFTLRKEPDTIPNIEIASGKFKSMSILMSIDK